MNAGASEQTNPDRKIRLRAMLWSHFVCRLLLGGIFLYAGGIKAGASEEFALALLPFMIIPEAWAGTIALLIAGTEILAGVLIVLPRVHRVGSLLIFLLALLFIAVLAWALMNGFVVSCSCFGREEPPSAGAMLLAIFRDAAIAAAAGFTLVFQPARREGCGSVCVRKASAEMSRMVSGPD